MEELAILLPYNFILIAGDLVYLCVALAKPLWQYTAKLLPGSITTLIVALIIYPCTILMFIPAYHKVGLWGKIGYIALWVCIYFGLEFVALKYNYIQHFNSWNLGYSFIFDCIVFPLLVLHQKKSALAWLLAGIIGISITVWFELPAPY